MENNIQTAQTTAISVPQWKDDELGLDNLMVQDVTPPRILLMQPMSEMVQDEKLAAKGGEIRESIGGKLLGGNGKPVHVIPFFTTNTWVIRRKVGNEWEYVRAEDRTGANATLDFEFTEDGVEHKREKTMNVFCFLYEDVLAETYVPYLMSFQRTSFTSAAKKLSQIMTLLQGAKRPLFSTVLAIDSNKQQNDKKQTYYTYSVQTAKTGSGEIVVPVEVQNSAFAQYKIIKEAYNMGKISKHVEEGASDEVSKY